MASRRRARFMRPCRTSRSWGFQPMTTRTASVRCGRREQRPTSPRTREQTGWSITCSRYAHWQRGWREVDSRRSFFAGHKPAQRKGISRTKTFEKLRTASLKFQQETTDEKIHLLCCGAGRVRERVVRAEFHGSLAGRFENTAGTEWRIADRY